MVSDNQTKKQNIKILGRLKKRSDFLRVQNQGVKWVAKGLILQVADYDPKGNKQRPITSPEAQTSSADNKPLLRYGLTVSKRASRSAVERNRIKRRLRALAEEELPVSALPGKDYILVGRTETLTYPYENLKKDLLWCLKRLSCLQENL